MCCSIRCVLNIGRGLRGIHFAVSFLEMWQKKQSGKSVDYLTMFAKDKNVIVLGGGDTGVDCIGTSLRQVGCWCRLAVHRAVLVLVS